MSPGQDDLGLTLGARIDRYEIERHLGIGAMGTVYLARDPTLDRLVAVKLLRADLVDRKDLMSRFKREAKAVARINHPHVVQVFDTGQHDECPYFVMEYLEGVDCGRLVQDYGPLPGPVVAAIGRDAARGLAEAGREAVIHRDVKPANLVVTERGQVKVTDFGLAKAQLPATNTGKLTMQGATLGTPDYMSPEQAMGADLDPRTDIYSLGATLFHLLAGRPPFRSLDEDVGHMEVVTRHVTDTAPQLDSLIPHVDKRLGVLVAEMMAKNADARPSYEEIETRLSAICAVLKGTLLEELRQRATAPHASTPMAVVPVAPDESKETKKTGSGDRAGETSLEGSTEAPTARRNIPPTQQQAAASQPLEIPRLLPRWTLVLSGLSLLIFGLSLTAYLIFQPGVRLRFLRGSRAATPSPPKVKTDLGADARVVPEGFVLLSQPGKGRLLVSRSALSRASARKILGAKRIRPGKDETPVRGLSLMEARRVAKALGHRLPTSEEWPNLVAEDAIELVSRGCEWVDDRHPGRKSKRGAKTRCFRRLAAQRRFPTRRYKDTVFRLVRALR